MGLIAGLDEVGMGCLAGPLMIVVAGFNQGTQKIDGVRDSKKVRKKLRRPLAEKIAEEADYLRFGWVDARIIDNVGMGEAWQIAAHIALQGITGVRELIVDGTRPVVGMKINQRTVVKGDDKHWQVGAASIVAKVLRDREMEVYAETYPGYGWETNAGYGTDVHRQAILSKGVTPIHRMTFLKKLLG